MDIMIIFQTMVKLLLILILGFTLNKLNILDNNTNAKLSGLIVNITCPLLVISSVSGLGDSVDRLAILPTLLGSFGLYFGLILLGEIISRLPIFKKEDRSINALMIVFANTSFMGIPVMESIYGTDAIFYNSIINFPFNILIYTYAILRLGSLNTAGGHTDGKPRLNLKLILNPGFIMTLLALVLFLTGIRLPAVVIDTCSMVGGITSPLSMLVLGSTIAMYPLKEAVTDFRCYLFSIVRLLIIPLLALGGCRLLGISEYITGVVVLSTAMPVAAMVLMTARQYGGNTERISRTILVTTVLSVVTIPIIASLL